MIKHKFLRVNIGTDTYLLELGSIKSGTLDIDKPAKCPCCHEDMTVVLDITQYGMFEDKFIILFSCVSCGKAYWYSYTLGAIDLVPLSPEQAEHTSV